MELAGGERGTGEAWVGVMNWRFGMENAHLAVLRAAGLPSYTVFNFPVPAILNLIFIKKFYIIYIENDKGELYMYNNDIYSRLLAGESMEDIMEDLTAQANEAQDRYNEFKRLEEERLRLEAAERKIREDAEREAKNAAKRDHLIDLISELLYFIAEHYPTFGVTTAEIDDISDEALGALADLAIMALDMEAAQKARQSFHTAMKLGPMTFPFHAPKATLSDTKSDTVKETATQNVLKDTPVHKPTADDVFASFFKTFM